MSEQLGRVERPDAERFKSGKKLYLVPLVYSSEEAPDEYKEKYGRYWRQVTEHLRNLESKIGGVKRVYHESVFQAGEDGVTAVKRLNQGSYEIARNECDQGAVFEPLEEKGLLEEVMDWQRCLMMGFMSEKVERMVFDFYLEAGKKRNEALSKRIEDTLKHDEAGLLFIREGHQVQFPADLQVFSISPPALDEIHRWHRDQARPVTEKPAEESKDRPEEELKESDRKTRRRRKRKTAE